MTLRKVASLTVNGKCKCFLSSFKIKLIESTLLRIVSVTRVSVDSIGEKPSVLDLWFKSELFGKDADFSTALRC